MGVLDDYTLMDRTERDSLAQVGLLDDVLPHTSPIRSTLESFDAQVATIAADPGRTDRGRHDEYEKLRDGTLTKLDPPTIVAQLEQDLAQQEAALTAALTASVPEPDPLALETLSRQIGGLDSVQLGALYATADERGRRAIEELAARLGATVRITPDGLASWQPLLDPELVASFREARAQAVAPELLTRLLRTRRVLNSVRSQFVGARKLIERATLR